MSTAGVPVFYAACGEASVTNTAVSALATPRLRSPLASLLTKPCDARWKILVIRSRRSGDEHRINA